MSQFKKIHITNIDINDFRLVSDQELEEMFTELIKSGMDPDDAGIATRNYELDHNFIKLGNIRYPKPRYFASAIDMIISIIRHARSRDTRNIIVMDNIMEHLDDYLNASWIHHKDVVSRYLDPAKEVDSFIDAYQRREITYDKDAISIAVDETIDEFEYGISKLVNELGADTVIRLYDDNKQLYIEALIDSLRISKYEDIDISPSIEFICKNKTVHPRILDLFNMGYTTSILLKDPIDRYHNNDVISTMSVDACEFPIPSIEISSDTMTELHMTNVISSVKRLLPESEQTFPNIIAKFDEMMDNLRNEFSPEDNVSIIFDDELISPTPDELKTAIRIASKFDDRSIRIACTATDILTNIDILTKYDVYGATFRRIDPVE